MRPLFSRPLLILNAVNLAIATVGVGVALRSANPDAMERLGALMAAVTGLFVIWQVAEEVLMERELRRNSTVSRGDDAIPALDRVARRLELSQARRRRSLVREARLLLVISIALWLSIGELLHGFGDIVFCSLMRRDAAACTTSARTSRSPTSVGKTAPRPPPRSSHRAQE
jgi:hypothetical protein